MCTSIKHHYPNQGGTSELFEHLDDFFSRKWMIFKIKKDFEISKYF